MEDPVTDRVTAAQLVGAVDDAAKTERVELLYREHRDLVYRLALRYGGPALYRNAGAGRFTDVTARAGLRSGPTSRCHC